MKFRKVIDRRVRLTRLSFSTARRGLRDVARRLVTCAAMAAVFVSGMPLNAAVLFWDADGAATGNLADGTNLGGSGAWNTTDARWWDDTNVVAWPNTGADQAVFTSPFVVGAGTANTVTLGGGLSANQLSFLRPGYTLTGGALTLSGASPTLDAHYATTTTIGSLLQGAGGLTKIGGGAVRLTNDGNTYTGTTTIANGSLIIGNQTALGLDTSAVVISGVGTRGYAGGQLVLDGGYASTFEFTRDLSLQGNGPIGDRSAAVIAVGNSNFSGTISGGVGAQATRLTSVAGRMTIAGALDVGGTTSTVTGLGIAANSTGTGSYSLTGVLTGVGILEKVGAGTLLLNPSDTSGFSGIVRISGSATGTTSSVRITQAGVLGTRPSTGTSGAVDLNGGTLEIRMDAPALTVGAVNASVYLRASSTLFVDHGIGGFAVNGNAAFNTLTFEDGQTFTFNGRNGYGASFTTASVNGGNGDSTFTNSLGGLLSFTGDFWNNTDNGSSRRVTIGGNGNTLINGNIIASSAAFNHTLTKSGSGNLTITGTASTLDGTVSISGGSLSITDFRTLTNNDQVINIGSGSTGGTLIIGNGVAATADGLTTNKVINLAGTTGSATIYANQAGTAPVIFNADFTATGGSSSNAKTLTLGGTNTADNVVNGRIGNNDAGGTVNLAKQGVGTWVLAGANTFTGSITITDGTLKLKDTLTAGTSRDVIASGGAVTFTSQSTTQEAGATLEYVGADGGASSELLGALTPSAGANAVRVTPGSGGTATLTFSSLGTIGSASSVNFVVGAGGSIVVNGVANGYNAGRLYYNGADFAYFVGGAVRAPVYGTDALFSAANVFTSGNHALITENAATDVITQKSVKLVGGVTLTLNGNLTLNSGTNTAGNILVTGGAAVIDGVGAITGPGSNVLGVRVDGASDTLTINGNITGISGGLNKNGLGKLILNGAGNTMTGTVTINEGEIELGAGSRLGGNGSSSFTNLTVRNDAVLDLGGNSIGVGSLNGSGLIVNDSATEVAISVGNSSGTGTWYGSFNDGTARLNVVKVGGGDQTWSGISNYTGVTYIGGTGRVTVNTLADIGQASGIGAGSAIDDATNAASLVFNGSTGGLSYAGILLNGAVAVGSTSASTDRLFTLAGTGATLSSTASNNNAVVWRNFGAIVHGVVGPQHLIFTGTSQGDNRFNPQLTDSGSNTNITSVTKSGTGVWVLGNTNNTYTGATTITQGTLVAAHAQSLPTNSNLVFDGGILQTQGEFNREFGTGPGQMQFAAPAPNTAQFGGGFAGGDSKLTLNWSGTPVWGVTPGFVNNRDGLIFQGSQARAQSATSSIALSEVEVKGNISLGAAPGVNKTATVTTTNSSATVAFTEGDTSGLVVGQLVYGPGIPSGAYILSINSANEITLSASVGSTAGTTGVVTFEGGNMRTIRVDDNTATGADFVTISGVLSGQAGTGLRKLGSGILQLFGANTYSGETNVNQGTLVVTSLGHSALAGAATSVGLSTNANLASNAITLGNGGTGGGLLQYVGGGETSDRYIRLFSTTGGNQIHADGSGALILTNVANDMVAGAKTLSLRGTNTAGNMITSVLADNGGALTIGVDGGATWILTNTNSYTGGTNVTAGALGIGADGALGSGMLTISNGSVFAYGGDRRIANDVTQSLSSNTIATFIGDYSLTIDGAWIDPSTTSTGRFIRNNIVAGKSLTLNGDYSATAGTSSPGVGFDGSGDTIVNGVISTTMANFGITYSGTGSLTLGGANTYTGATTVTSGTLRLGADNVIPDGAGKGNLVMNPAVGVTARLDLNGHFDTVNALTANSLGTAVIDNTSSAAAGFTFGNLDTAATFIGEVRNTGAGGLSLTKIGTGAALFSQGAFAHRGATTVNGGSLTFAGDVTATDALIAAGPGTLLALTGGHSGAAAVRTVFVAAGAELNLFNGLGQELSGLTSLTLGAGSVLNLNAGATTDTLRLLSTYIASVSGTVTLNVRDTGSMLGNSSYDLLVASSGGLTSGGGNYVLNQIPGGFTSLTLKQNDTRVWLETGSLQISSLYWTGATSTAWNAVNASFEGLNWSGSKTGSPTSAFIPGAGSTVIFQANGAVGGAVTTTLEQGFRINNLVFEASTNTPTSITIAAGVDGANKLTIDPSNTSSADGIELKSGGPAAVTISAPLGLGSNQTWTVADAASALTISGPLSGSGTITKAGAGKVVLSSAADPTFAAPTVTVNGGNLEVGNTTALGSLIVGNAATVVVNTGGGFYFNGTGSTFANAISLNGGTLSGGTATHTYSGAIDVAQDSFINLRDLNSTAAAGTARSLAISGPLSGTGKLTIDGNNTTSSSNQISGTLTLSGNNAAWSGGLELLRGTVSFTNVNAVGTGDITARFGRLLFNTAGNTTFDLAQTITLDGPGGILELNADASGTPLVDMTVNFNGAIRLGSATNANMALRLVQNGTDNRSILAIHGGIVLGNHASISTSGSATRDFVIDTVGISETMVGSVLTINDDLGGWGQTNQTLAINVASSYTGGTVLAAGRLRFGHKDAIGTGSLRVTGGTLAASLDLTGSNAVANPLNANGTVTMDGAFDLELSGLVTVNNTARTFTANGDEGADFILSGGITGVSATDGEQLIFAGNATGRGFVTGGVTMSGSGADIRIASGNWTFSGAPIIVADDLLVVGAAAVLNLNSTGVLSNPNAAGTSNGMYIRGGAIVNLGADDVNGVNNANGMDFIFVGDSSSAGSGTFNTNGYSITVPRLEVGGTGDAFTGFVLGDGTINLTSTTTDYGSGIRLFRGEVTAKLAGPSTILKQGLGDVTLSADNSGLTGTVNATRVDAGNLILDYSTDNNNKISSAAGLEMRGGTLTLKGGVLAATDQEVTNLTLTNGSNRVTISGGEFSTTLNVNGITRNANSGTLRVTYLDSNSVIATDAVNSATTGLLGNAAFATVKVASGTWFATADGGVILGYESTEKNDVASWLDGDHVTDAAGGFSGTLSSSLTLNSLRFNDAAGSRLDLANDAVLTLASGGILVTDEVTGGAPGIFGGVLASGASNELILINESSARFEISSELRGSTTLTLAGRGLTRLSGNNTSTGQVLLQSGTLELAGGNAMSDTTLITLADDQVATLKFLADETTGRLAGGSNSDGLRTAATIDIGSYTVTTNTTSSATYAGQIVGDGTLVKFGAGDWTLSGVSTGFSGTVIINQAALTLSSVGRLDAQLFIVNKGGALFLDNNGSTRSGARILDAATVQLNSADGSRSGETIVRGFGFRTDQDSGSSNTETIGMLAVASGANYVSLQHSGGNNSRAIIVASSIARQNAATLDVRGRTLGSNASTGGQGQLRIATAGEAAFIGAMIGGGTGLGTTTQSIVPWMIAESFTGNLADANMGNSLATYVAGRGFMALDFATDYAAYASAVAMSNTRQVLSADIGGWSGKTINSLVLHNNATVADTTYGVAGTGAGQALTNSSGAFLFTLNPTAVAGAYGTNLGGFDGGIFVGATNEYVFHVVNPSGAVASNLTATINSPLASAADITKSGRGTLSLTAVNTAGGGARKTTVNEGVLEIVDLDNIGGDSGELVFAGGALRLAATYGGDDLSLRTISFLLGGGSIDTNGLDLTLAGSLGSGVGGFTKLGLGTLTLTANASFTGGVEVRGGGLTYNSIGNFGDGPSPLGNPATAASAIIRMGSGSAATTLTYNGEGHSTDRLIAMQGSTGRVTLNADGNGPIVYAGGVTGTASGSKTLALGGNSMSDVVNRLGLVSNGSGTISLLMQGPNAWELMQSNTYTGSTTIDEGILILSAAQTMTGSLNFGSANTITTAGLLDLRENASFGTFTVRTDTISAPTVQIAEGKSLTFNGNVTIGNDRAALTNTAFSAQGEGTFVVNPSATLFAVGGYTAGTAGGGNLATADFSGLAAMQINLNPSTGNVRIGNTSGAAVAGVYTVLALARDTAITASQLNVGAGGQYNGAAGQVNRLLLGTGTTTINVNTVNIGTGSRDFGAITFQQAGSGTVTIRATDGVGAAAFNMGTGSASTSASAGVNANVFDVTGHDADLLFSTMTIGTQTARTGAMANEFYFDTGKLVVQNGLTMGSKTATGNSINTINLGGGTVSFGATSGIAATLAANTNTGTVRATINITGGAADFAGDIVRGEKSGTGTATATINLDGGALYMNGARIGAAEATGEVVFNARSGRLANLAELNGGGALTKTSTGSLVLAGTNGYTGATNVNQGVLTVDGTITGAGAVTVGSTTTAVLNGSGSIAGAVTVTAAGTFSAGSSGAQTQVPGNDGNGVGMLTLGSSLTWDAGSTLVFDFSGVDPLNGTDGAGTNWDFIDISGALNIGATPTNKINVFIDSWNAAQSAYGEAEGFDGQVPESAYPESSYRWLWATADDGINLSGDLNDYFNVTASRGGMGVPNANPAGGTFWVSAVGSDLYINYSSVPEPGSLVLLGVAGLGFAAYRRRKAKQGAETTSTEVEQAEEVASG